MKKCNHPCALNRRSFLKIGGMSVTALMAGGPLFKAFGQAANNGRILVIIELAGGNDALNTVVPYSNPRYYDWRPTVGIRDRLLPLDAEHAFHPALVSMRRLYDEGKVAVVRGPGLTHPEVLSHFFSFAALRSGHIGGFTQTPAQTGWPGRIIDRLASSEDYFAGLTLASASNPAMTSQSEKTVAASQVEDGLLPVPAGFETRFRAAQQGMAQAVPGDPPSLRAAKKGVEAFLNLSDFLVGLRPSGVTYPETETARLLAFTARVLASTDRMRVFWINADGVFDTHSAQAVYQAANLAELDGAVNAFLAELGSIAAPDGGTLADRVAVAIMSEFGRTGQENQSAGTDHGKATSFFVVGNPVRGGLYGEPPPLEVDIDGSLVPTMSLFDLPYTLTQWMGVDPDAVFPDGGNLIANLFH